MFTLAFAHHNPLGFFLLLFLGFAAVFVVAVAVVSWLAGCARGRRQGAMEARLKAIEEKLDRLNKPAP